MNEFRTLLCCKLSTGLLLTGWKDICGLAGLDSCNELTIGLT